MSINRSNGNRQFRPFNKMRVFAVFFIVFLITLFMISATSKSSFDLNPVPHENFKYAKETTIYVLTPTYARPVQKAELTRLSQTLRLIKDIHWVIIEDSPEPTQMVSNLLKKTNLNFTHLVQPTPSSWKLKKNEGRWSKARGVIQRNAALTWVRENLTERENGVIYFADDDNTYSTELFEEMRYLNKVGVWPVGLVGGLNVESPLVENGRVVGFNSAWRPERKFPIDMAGFAVSLKHFLSKPNAEFSYESQGGFQETDFLSKLTTRDELEPKAKNCTQILVWHTRTEKPGLIYEDRLRKQGKKPSDWLMEV